MAFGGKGGLYLLATVSFTVCGQILLKKGVPTGSVLSLRGVVGNPFILAGAFFYTASLFFWLNALKLLPLSVAAPSASASYVLIVGASAIFLGEPLTLNKAIGVALVCVGVFLIGRG
ncbi:MAG: EamA family transporter [Spirochaetales bacterium]|nr:EamA family transporter [Spirochaetales bacterium]